MSGLTPYCSIPNIVPVRPKPQITSSKMSRMSCSFSTGAMAAQYPWGGTTTPPAPCTGSPIMPVMVGRGEMDEPWHRGTEALVVGRDPGGCQSPHGDTVVGHLAGENLDLI